MIRCECLDLSSPAPWLAALGVVFPIPSCEDAPRSRPEASASGPNAFEERRLESCASAYRRIFEERRQATSEAPATSEKAQTR